MASFTAAGTSYATRGVPMVPFFIFYSMFGFQRVGDLIWAAADAQATGFLLGATAGRTTLLGEGLQHQDGHSLVLASTVPTCQAYDPAFAYEMAAIVRARHRTACTAPEPDDDVFYYLTLYNENYPMPPRPDGVDRGDIIEGLYRWAPAPDGLRAAGHDPVLGLGAAARPAFAQAELAERYGVGAELWCGHLVQAAARGRARRSSAGTGCTRRRARAARRRVTELARRPRRARSWP